MTKKPTENDYQEIIGRLEGKMLGQEEIINKLIEVMELIRENQEGFDTLWREARDFEHGKIPERKCVVIEGI